MAHRKPKTPDTFLMARTAEMLALPEMACRQRECRRKRRCSRFFSLSGEPCCLANLDARQRALFDQLLTTARDARDFGSWKSKVIFASAYRGEREMQDAAVEIARPAISAKGRRCFREFVAAREKQPAPLHAGFASPLPKW